MVFSGSLRNDQPLGDLGVGQAFHHESEHFELSSRQTLLG